MGAAVPPELATAVDLVLRQVHHQIEMCAQVRSTEMGAHLADAGKQVVHGPRVHRTGSESEVELRFQGDQPRSMFPRIGLLGLEDPSGRGFLLRSELQLVLQLQNVARAGVTVELGRQREPHPLTRLQRRDLVGRQRLEVPGFETRVRLIVCVTLLYGHGSVWRERDT